MILKDLIDSDDNQIRRNSSKPKGWAKSIETLNARQKNGYGLIGDWVNKNTQLHEGQVYLDASPISSESNKIRYSVFTIKNQKLNIIAQTEKQQGWAKEIWDDVEFALAENGLNPAYIYSILKDNGIGDEDIISFCKAFNEDANKVRRDSL